MWGRQRAARVCPYNKAVQTPEPSARRQTSQQSINRWGWGSGWNFLLFVRITRTSFRLGCTALQGVPFIQLSAQRLNSAFAKSKQTLQQMMKGNPVILKTPSPFNKPVAYHFVPTSCSETASDIRLISTLIRSLQTTSLYHRPKQHRFGSAINIIKYILYPE